MIGGRARRGRRRPPCSTAAARGSPALRERGRDADGRGGRGGRPRRRRRDHRRQQALDLVGKIFLDPGDVVALEAPAYVGALTAFGAYEPRFLPIEIDDDGHGRRRARGGARSGERPSFVYTVPNFGNPAGVTLSYERRHRLVALCREAGIPIIEDNPYGLLRFDGDPLPCLRALDPENVIYLGTVSKTFSPGVRVGWALAEQSVVQRLVLAKEAADLCGSNLNMLVTERWFADEARWRSTLATARRDVPRSRRDAMLEAVAGALPGRRPWTEPAGGFYVWVTLPPWMDAKAMLAAAVERRVAYVPGTAFFPDGRGTDQMRLAFCYPPSERIRRGHRAARARSSRTRSSCTGAWGADEDRGARRRTDPGAGRLVAGRAPCDDMALARARSRGVARRPRGRPARRGAARATRPSCAGSRCTARKVRTDRPAPPRSPGDRVHGDRAARLRGRVRQGARERRPAPRRGPDPEWAVDRGVGAP